MPIRKELAILLGDLYLKYGLIDEVLQLSKIVDKLLVEEQGCRKGKEIEIYQ